jgi:L-malate glycosyltransferase
MVINQWIPAAHEGDAVGNTARQYRDRLRDHGHDSEIYAMEVAGGLDTVVRRFTTAADAAGDVTILHFATPSPLSRAFASLGCARVLQYHNITPPHFFRPFSPELARLSLAAQAELKQLVGNTDLALGVSEFNRRELERLGFRDTGVLPLAVDTRRIRRPGPVPALECLLKDGLTNILFVGRIVPNKKLEDIIRLGEVYRRLVGDRFRLIFAGRPDVVPGYYEMLRVFIGTLGWPPERCVFTGAVPDDELAAYYRHAHVYVSMSEHEGFCAPLVEAMAADVPVLAYASTAVSETLGGAGIEFAPKDFGQAAALLDLLVHDGEVRARVIEGQRRRLTHFSSDRIDAGLRALAGRFQ